MSPKQAIILAGVPTLVRELFFVANIPPDVMAAIVFGSFLLCMTAMFGAKILAQFLSVVGGMLALFGAIDVAFGYYLGKH